MAWAGIEIVSNALKLFTYYFNPKERKRRRKITFLKKISNLRAKQVKAQRRGNESLWNQLDREIIKLIEEAKKIND